MTEMANCNVVADRLELPVQYHVPDTSSSSQGKSQVHVSIRNVSKRFGSFLALRSVDLDIVEGEFVCFLGPSGCGKTTLLRAIAGLDPQSEGSIYLAGRDVSHLPPSERDFGIVFQSYALFPNLTVKANVAYGLVNRRMKKAEIAGRVAALLETVSLTDQADKYPVQLSGGQQQRVALARALATEPSLLLLDEPLSALDARVRIRLRDELKSLQRRLGLTTIMVTHDQEEAMGLADRIVVINRGVIEQIGTPSDVYANPQSAFVADFIGTMNFIDCEVVGEKQLKIGNLTLDAQMPIRKAAGTTVRVAIRPEELRLGQLDAANSFEGRVKSIGFHGGFCRVSLLLLSKPDATVLADIPAQALAGLSLSEGQPLTVSMPPERLLIFPPN